MENEALNIFQYSAFLIKKKKTKAKTHEWMISSYLEQINSPVKGIGMLPAQLK